ncbi:Trihelix transcription factor ASR3 [Cardamine amara subsp. amara]|uniref:Trihelix transcription factor ASR3 n=1 Tax=Cardamine amara subsp. amara TaxID=228776 RepID=A0ABD1AX52_CARAN
MADPSGGGGDMVTREYRKGNWTVTETLMLIEAKKMDEERRVRRSATILPLEKQPESRNRPAELRWKWIEEYCYRKGCMRNQNQCNDKWDNLMRDYKKIREYERSRVESSFDTSSSSPASYLEMEKSERKERNLPSNMLPQIYDALAELVERNSLPTPSIAPSAVRNGHGGQILRVSQQILGYVAPMMAQAQPMHQIPATIVLPLPPPPPPPPQSVVLSLSPPPPQPPPSSTYDVEPIEPTTLGRPNEGEQRREKPPSEERGRKRRLRSEWPYQEARL